MGEYTRAYLLCIHSCCITSPPCQLASFTPTRQSCFSPVHNAVKPARLYVSNAKERGHNDARHSATRTSRGTALQPPPIFAGEIATKRSLRSKQLRMMWTCICAWKQMHVYNGICIPSAEPWYQGVSDLLLTVELTTDVTPLPSNLGGNLLCPWRGAEACAVG